MKTIDRYILARYIGNVVWALIAATVVFLVIDLVENLDKFIDSRVPAPLVLRYYLLYVPYILYLIMPVSALLATLFTIGGMTNSNELAALHVSGVPFSRPLSLLIFITCLMAVGTFMVGETLVPGTNRERMDIFRYEVKRLPRETRARYGSIYLQLDRERQLFISQFKPATLEAYGVSIIQTAEGRIASRLDAPKMVWLNRGWELQNATLWRFENGQQASFQRGVPYRITGVGLQPEDFEKVQTAPEEMNWWELRDYIDRLQRSGSSVHKWRTDLLFKVSLPAAAVIIVLFGAPVAARRRRGGTAMGFGISLLICFVYFGFIQVGKVLGYKGTISPFLSAWSGNIFFGLLGMGLLTRHRG